MSSSSGSGGLNRLISSVTALPSTRPWPDLVVMVTRIVLVSTWTPSRSRCTGATNSSSTCVALGRAVSSGPGARPVMFRSAEFSRSTVESSTVFSARLALVEIDQRRDGGEQIAQQLAVARVAEMFDRDRAGANLQAEQVDIDRRQHERRQRICAARPGRRSRRRRACVLRLPKRNEPAFAAPRWPFGAASTAAMLALKNADAVAAVAVPVAGHGHRRRAARPEAEGAGVGRTRRKRFGAASKCCCSS